jgi:hypothetical protein
MILPSLKLFVGREVCVAVVQSNDKAKRYLLITQMVQKTSAKCCLPKRIANGMLNVAFPMSFLGHFPHLPET